MVSLLCVLEVNTQKSCDHGAWSFFFMYSWFSQKTANRFSRGVRIQGRSRWVFLVFYLELIFNGASYGTVRTMIGNTTGCTFSRSDLSRVILIMNTYPFLEETW